MKKHTTIAAKRLSAFVLIAAFAFLSPYSLYSADPADCGPNSDACSAGTKKVSPFLKASMEGNKDSAAAPAEKKRPAVLKEAAAPSVDASTAVPAEQPEKPGNISDPAWLILVAGGITMLYLYLREGRKKRRRK